VRLPRHRRRPPAPSPEGAGGSSPATTHTSRRVQAIVGAAGVLAGVLVRAVRAGAVLGRAQPEPTEPDPTDADPTDADPTDAESTDAGPGGGNHHGGDTRGRSTRGRSTSRRRVDLRVIRPGGHRCGVCGAPSGPSPQPFRAGPGAAAGSGDDTAPIGDTALIGDTAAIGVSGSGSSAGISGPAQVQNPPARSPQPAPQPVQPVQPVRAGGRRWGSVVAVAVAAVGLMLLSGGVSVVVFGHPTTPTVAAQGVLPAVGGTPEQGSDGLTAPPRAAAAAVAAPAAPPTHLSIPAVGVNTDLINLATQDDGTLEVPKNFALAGWWDQGAAPGDPGPAVIVGHIDSYRGPAVFYRLRQLTPGALVTVARSDGSSAQFAVDALREFPKEAFPTNLVYGATNTPTLRLITCGGSFDDQARSYLDNIVVFAHQIPLPAPAAGPPARSGTSGSPGPGSPAPGSPAPGSPAPGSAASNAGSSGRAVAAGQGTQSRAGAGPRPGTAP